MNGRPQADKAAKEYLDAAQPLLDRAYGTHRGDQRWRSDFLAMYGFANELWLLGPVIENVTVVGGSDAQVGLRRQTYLCGLIEAGRKSEARAPIGVTRLRKES